MDLKKDSWVAGGGVDGEDEAVEADGALLKDEVVDVAERDEGLMDGFVDEVDCRLSWLEMGVEDVDGDLSASIDGSDDRLAIFAEDVGVTYPGRSAGYVGLASPEKVGSLPSCRVWIEIDIEASRPLFECTAES